MGNSLAVDVSESGAVSSGKKMPEMNSSGKIEKLTMAGAASALGHSPLTASPRAQKQAAPRARVANSTSAVPIRKFTPKATTPRPTVRNNSMKKRTTDD